MMIQAVFWDYDNTILASAEAHWKKHQTVLARHGIELCESYRKRIYENNGSQNWVWLKQELGLEVAEKEYLEAIDFEFQRHMSSLEMRSGVAELFDLIENLRIPQAIITNARKNSAKPVLDKKNITSRMEFILFKEDYEGRKPQPAPYLRGFEKMELLMGKSLEPKRCLVIEDDPLGVESAHKAGGIVIQRKLNENEQASPYANYSCFLKDDFIKIGKTLLEMKEWA